MHHYKAFNLHFITPFICPELLPLNKEEEKLSKVTVTLNKTPEKLNPILNETPYFQANNEELLLKLPEVGNFYIAYGDTIIIEKEDNTVDEDTLRLFLLGSAIGALLYQRGYIPLHASGIKTPKGALLFCGFSGAGKSTTLQAFIRRGYKKISDDTIALYYNAREKRVMCIPSYPQSKLWSKSLELLEYQNDNLRQIMPAMEKYAYPTKAYFYNQEIPLYAICVLDTHEGDEIKVTDVQGSQKFTVIKNQTYRKEFIEKLKYKKEYLHFSLLLANQIKIKHIVRPLHGNSLNAIANAIEDAYHL